MGTPVPNDSKPFYKSITIWLNVAAAVAVGLQLAMNNQIIPVQYQELAIAVLNILNRFRTNSAVTLT